MTTDSEPIFGYVSAHHIKLYRPSSRCRFLQSGSIPGGYSFGLEQLPTKGGLLFITGGEKDVLSLSAHGFNAISFNSETAMIPLDVIHNLSYRFKHIVLLFGVDKTGLKSSKVQQERLSGEKKDKDVSDYFKAGNRSEDLMSLFVDYLDRLYDNTLTSLKSCEVDLNKPLEESRAIISINGILLGSEGNLMCFTGAERTGKSNYTAALISGPIKEKDIRIDTLGVDVESNHSGKAVLFYDTEQSEVQLFKNVGKLLSRAGRNALPDYCHVYCLTGMTRSERLQSIEQSMDKFYYQHGGILLMGLLI